MNHIYFSKSEGHNMAFCHWILPFLKCQGTANHISDAPWKHHAMVHPVMPAPDLRTPSFPLKLLSWKFLVVSLYLHLKLRLILPPRSYTPSQEREFSFLASLKAYVINDDAQMLQVTIFRIWLLRNKQHIRHKLTQPWWKFSVKMYVCCEVVPQDIMKL